MGRGAQKATQREIDQQLAANSALTQQLLGERAGARNLLLPQYQQVLAAPGFSPTEKAAITGESLGALGGVFDALRQRAANRLASTRNAAGFGELLDELAREQGRGAAEVARRNQIDFADEAFRRQMDALRGLGGLYGVDTGLLARNLDLPPELLSARARASQSGGSFRFGFGPFGFSLG